MITTRRTVLTLTAGAVFAPAVLRIGSAQAAEVTLKLHHFLPPAANVPKHFLIPWAQKVEQDSGGRIKVEMFPSMSLGGAPPQLYDQARDGVVDLVWTVAGYTAGRFPRSEVIENPFVSHSVSMVNCQAVQELVDTTIGEEFSDVKPICAFAHDRGVFHVSKRLEKLEDFKGMKLRFPTRIAGESIKALGAAAIGMPVPQVPESIAQGAINGAIVPWEVVPSVKLDELVKFHTEIPGKRSFYNTVFLLVMNKARHAGLPADLRDVIDKNSGLPAARMASLAFDKTSPEVVAMVEKKNGTIVTISDEEAQRWIKATAPVIDGWISQMKGRNIDGGQLVETMRALITKYDVA